MTPEEKSEVKEKLEKAILETEQEICRLKEQSKPVSPDDAIGRLTRMDAIQSKSISEASLRRFEVKLESLKKSLSRIDDASFGLCQICSQPIQIKRLIFLPESTVCIKCAQ